MMDPSIISGAIDAASFVLKLYTEFKTLPQALEDFRSYVTHVRSVLEGIVEDGEEIPDRVMPIVEDILKQLQNAHEELSKHRRRNVAVRALRACLSDSQKQFLQIMANLDRYLTLLLATRAKGSAAPKFAQTSMQAAVLAAMDRGASAQDMKRAIIALDTAALAADGQSQATLLDDCSRFRTNLCSGGSFGDARSSRIVHGVEGVTQPLQASKRDLVDVHTRMHWLLKQKKDAMEEMLGTMFGPTGSHVPAQYLAEMRSMMQELLSSMLSAEPAANPLRPVMSDNLDRLEPRGLSRPSGAPRRVTSGPMDFSDPGKPPSTSRTVRPGPFYSPFGDDSDSDCQLNVKLDIMACPVIGLPYGRKGPMVPRHLEPCGCTMSTKAINDLLASRAACPQCGQRPDPMKSRRCEVDEAAIKVVAAKRDHRLSMMTLNIKDIPEMDPAHKTAAIIGRGAEATVYKCAHSCCALNTWDGSRCTWLDTPVAVKEIVTADLSASERTQLNRVLEITALAAATSDHIAQLYGVAWESGSVCVVSELCDCSVQDFVKQRKEQSVGSHAHAGPPAGLPVEEVLRIGVHVASALSALHMELKTWHLDVCPGNILLTGKPFTAKLTDFGIAKRVATARWMTKAIGGTATFTPPETIMTHEATATSDVYSLAATLVFAATGQPISNCTDYQLIQQVKADGCLRMPAAVPGELRGVLQRALLFDPKARPSISEFRDFLVSAHSRVLGGRRKSGRMPSAPPSDFVRAPSAPAPDFGRAPLAPPSDFARAPSRGPLDPLRMPERQSGASPASLKRLLSGEQPSHPGAVRHLCYTKRSDLFVDLVECICFFSSLTHLSLKDCALGVSQDPIQERLFSQLPTSLEELDLEKNYLGPKGARVLKTHLHRLCKLKVLNVARNSLSDPGAMSLAAALPSVGDTLISLRAKTNDFKEAGYQALAACLPRLCKLRELQLDQPLPLQLDQKMPLSLPRRTM